MQVLALCLKARGNGEAGWSSEDGVDVGVSQAWAEEQALNRACFLPEQLFLIWQVGEVILCPPGGCRGQAVLSCAGTLLTQACPVGSLHLGTTSVRLWPDLEGFGHLGSQVQSWGGLSLAGTHSGAPTSPMRCPLRLSPSPLWLAHSATLLGGGSKRPHPKHPLSGIC